MLDLGLIHQLSLDKQKLFAIFQILKGKGCLLFYLVLNCFQPIPALISSFTAYRSCQCGRTLDVAKTIMKERLYVHNKLDNLIDLSRDGKLQDVSSFDPSFILSENVIFY